MARLIPALVLALCLGRAGFAAELKAGAGVRKITPPLEPAVYLAGFGANRVATGVHDDLWARCLALSAGSRPVVLCAVDLIGLFHDDVERIRSAVPEAQVIAAATHVHQGPDTMGQWGPKPGVSGLNEAYNAFVVSETAAAAKEALAALQPARLYPAAVTPPDVRSYYNDSRPPVVHDAGILSLSFRTPQGRPVATLVNWSNHPEALGGANTLITSDYVHYLRAMIEKGGLGPVIFINGALGGMQSPLGAKIIDPDTGRPAPRDSFRFAQLAGEYAARHVLASQKRARAARAGEILYRETMVTIPVANQLFLLAAQAGLFGGRKAFTAQRETAAPAGYLRLSARGKPVVEAVLVPGELYPELSVGGVVRDPGADFPDAPPEPPLKAMLSAPYRLLFGLANDEIGYIIPKCQWDEKPPYTFGATRRWYGEVNSAGPEAAPRLASAIRSLVAP